MKRNVIIPSLFLALTVSCFASPLAPNTAVILIHGTPLYDESNKVLKAIDYLTLGDIVTLLNRTGTFSESGKDRDFTRVRAPNGREGWSRTQFMATKATLAMVKADKTVIYSEPRDVKLTSRNVSGLTLVAVLQDGSTATFAKIQGYDAAQGVLFTDSTFVTMDDLTTSIIDVNAGILIDVAAATKDAVVKKNLLTIALKKYSQSVFLPRIQAALGIDASPSPAAESDSGGADGGN
jgi:hypothetical protein